MAANGDERFVAWDKHLRLPKLPVYFTSISSDYRITRGFFPIKSRVRPRAGLVITALKYRPASHYLIEAGD